jgi:hypothetical protein
VVAWVRANTLHLGCRSPFAITKAEGRPLTKADLARDMFDGYRGNACRAWNQAAALGLVFENERGFLCLSGRVELPPGKKRRKSKPLLSVETALPRYLIEAIGTLAEEKQDQCKTAFIANEHWRAAP